MNDVTEQHTGHTSIAAAMLEQLNKLPLRELLKLRRAVAKGTTCSVKKSGRGKYRRNK